jgi:hypothetical protein
VILAEISQYDTGIELDQARGSTVVHNTVVETDAATGSFSSIDYRFANTSVAIRNNLVRRITVRNGAAAELANNVEDVPSSWFADVASGDVHLRPTATGAIDTGRTLGEGVAGRDLDGTAHDVGAPDVGADELTT